MAAPLLGGSLDQSAHQHYLEDYFAGNNEAAAPDHEVVELAFTLPQQTDGKSTADFYEQAVANLKKKSPKLEKLRLRGGVAVNPKDSKSADELKSELEAVVDELKALDRVANAAGLRLRRLVFTALLGFEKEATSNVSEQLKKAYGEEVQQHGDDSWTVPFKIEHGRGLLKVQVRRDEEVTGRPQGRSRYFPVSAFKGRMGPGPMLGSATYDAEKNVTRIWSAKKGAVELPGNHMDSEELDEYLPRNFDNE